MRLRSVQLLLVVCALVAIVGAWVDKPHADVTHAPHFVSVRKPWDAVVELSRRGRRLDGFRPVLQITGTDGSKTFTAKAIGSGRYRVQVVFPQVGEYTYSIVVAHQVAVRGQIVAVPE
jgi:hypothetical protein